MKYNFYSFSLCYISEFELEKYAAICFIFLLITIDEIAMRMRAKQMTI